MPRHRKLESFIYCITLTLTACGDSCGISGEDEGTGGQQGERQAPYKIICGDDIIEGAEQCDALNLNGKSCLDFGFTGGLLMCDARCEYNTFLCTKPPEVICGDGVMQGAEQCDSQDIKPRACPADTIATCESCQLRCEPGPPEAKLLVDTQRVAFGKTSVGNINQRLITLTNAGVARIELKNIALEGQAEGIIKVSFPDPAAPSDTLRDQQRWSPSLKFQATQLIRIIYAPLTDEPLSDKLIIESNDPDNPRIIIPIAAQATPCMAISQPKVELPSPSDEDYRLHFGATTLSTINERLLRITNCSPHAPLELQEVSFSQENTGLFHRLSPGRPLPNHTDQPPATLDVGEAADITLSYEPQQTGDHFNTMTIRSDDPNKRRQKILLSGTGRAERCPMARIIPSSADQASLGLVYASPGQAIKLTATAALQTRTSELVSYTWRVQRAPNALAVRLLDEDAQVATLEVEDEGDYVVTLSVTDVEGRTSCEPEQLHIKVNADARPASE